LITDSGVGWRAERQARFAAGNVLDALAPSNFPWSNPAVIKAVVDEGGANLVRGARHFAHDFPGRPSTVDTSSFAVGENLATTPGSVVLRTEVFELLQYAPQTEQVREVPLLFAPPTINRFYVLDLAQGRAWTSTGDGHEPRRHHGCLRTTEDFRAQALVTDYAPWREPEGRSGGVLGSAGEWARVVPTVGGNDVRDVTRPGLALQGRARGIEPPSLA
jgi:hypothetical protein